ncbi:MAG: metallophosphoesterase [Chloroflexi bacterium]|nr:MAG: metallophosphoesterase [Chloroflexota bacterium]
MSVIVFGDLHANCFATRYLAAKLKEYEDAWCLGDFLGRGPHAVDMLNFIEEYSQKYKTWVIGNHDAYVWDLISDDEKSRYKNEVADTLRYHKQILEDQENKLTKIMSSKRGDLQWDGKEYAVVHASPTDPLGVREPYIFPWKSANIIMDNLVAPFTEVAMKKQRKRKKTPNAVLFVGHSHVPMFINWSDKQGFRNLDTEIIFGVPLSIPDGITIINPGSIGNPRIGSNTYVELDRGARTITFQPFRLSTRSKNRLRDEQQGLGFSAEIRRSFQVPPDTNKIEAEFPEFYKNLSAREKLYGDTIIEIGIDHCIKTTDNTL